MKALSLTQPWASLVAAGAKRIETRSWNTAWRGWMAIHAAKDFPRSAQVLALGDPFRQALEAAGYRRAESLPTGAIIAVGFLRDVYRFGPDAGRHAGATERAFGDFSPGRYGFRLDSVAKLRRPIPCRGTLGIWNVPAAIADLVRSENPGLAWPNMAAR